jgi:hypothetical protein
MPSDRFARDRADFSAFVYSALAAAERPPVRYPQTKYLELCLHKDVYAMFKPYYHQHALSLAKTTPAYSMDAAQQISEIVTSLGTTLPQSITEWLCLDPDVHLFHQMTQFPHDFVRIPDLPNHIAKRHFHGQDVLAVELIFENQGCFVMAASLEDGDNPPVWISSDFYFCGSEEPSWLLHSQSFSDCIEGFAWDFNCIDNADGNERFRGVDVISEQAESTNHGPTTYLCSAWFKSREFRRIELDSKRLTFMLD